MIRSINEIQGLVLKAARGAGVPFGICEDLSACVPHALENGALDDIADILWRDDHSALLGDIAALDARTCGQEVSGPPATTQRLADALAAASGFELEPKAASGARPVADALWDRLEILAARTYVPANAASRATGAGAGLTDND